MNHDLASWESPQLLHETVSNSKVFLCFKNAGSMPLPSIFGQS